MSDTIIDTRSEFGARAGRRLQIEPIGWLTTVALDATPQSGPVDRNEAYLSRYREVMIGRLRLTPQRFAATHSVPIRVDDRRVSGH